jgi:hypothetical protein
MAMADVMAGRTIHCSRCGGDVHVPATPGVAPSSRKKVDATPSIEISSAIITSAVGGGALLVIVLVLYFGPWAVGRKWAAMSSQADTQVTDVVDFAIKAYESQKGTYDAIESHHVPAADGPARFVAPYMAFTLPRKIVFSGKTNQGNYMGTYDTTTGEIIADIETGGYSVGGLVDVKKATGSFHMTGREKDGQVEAEADGIPLQIVIHKPPARGDE